LSFDDQAMIAGLRDKLLVQIDTNSTLRDLAGTPLLCALLCALNLDRSGQLPRDRMDLYRVALSALLIRRDLERRLPQDISSTLTEAERIAILMEFSWWMALNNRNTASISDFKAAVQRSLPQLKGVTDSSDKIAEFLLKRSGILRSPEEGVVDFIHKSFQEFLASQTAVDGGHIGLLVERGSQDTWFNIVAMACGHANSVQRKELILGLLAAGDSEIRSSEVPGIPAQHAAAAMCLDYSPVVQPELISEIEKRLNGLLPPPDAQSVAILVATGDASARLIDSWLEPNRSPAGVLNCMLVLRTIGGDEAVKVFSKIFALFRDDVGIVQVLLEAALGFDVDNYVMNVFGDKKLDIPLRLTLDQASVAERVPGIKSYTLEIALYPEDSASDRGGLPILEKVDALDIEVRGALDLSALPTTPNARLADVLGCESLRSYSGLNRSARLEVVSADGMAARASISGIRIPELKELRVLAGELSLEDQTELPRRGVKVSLP
jgi:hypothetical protein